MNVSDGALVRACRAGDGQAWAALVTRFSRYVHAIATQAFRLSEADAEDVFQEVFARTYEHLGRLRDDDAIRPWIGQLTRRLAIDKIRAGSREQLEEDTPEGIDVRAEDELERLEQAMVVRQAMAELPENCHEILDRFFAQDQTYGDIAADLDIPMGTIASRISRCLGKLRSELADTSSTGGFAGEKPPGAKPLGGKLTRPRSTKTT